MSRPNRIRMMLVFAFALALAAGLVAGAALARQAWPSGQPVTSELTTGKPGAVTPPERNWIADQLNLDPQQRGQVTAIWKETPHDKVRAVTDRRRNLFRERDEALAAVVKPEQKAERERIHREFAAKIGELVRERDEATAAVYTPEQRAERDRITKDYTAQLAALSKERDQLMQPMVEKTRQLLTEDQRKRFDGMMKGGGGDRGDRGDRDHRRGGPPNRSGTQPSTRPFDGGNGRPPFDGSDRDRGGDRGSR